MKNKTFFWLCFSYFLTLSVLDGVSTVMALNRGFFELNPVMRQVPLNLMVPVQILGAMLTYGLFYWAISICQNKGHFKILNFVKGLLIFSIIVKGLVVFNNFFIMTRY